MPGLLKEHRALTDEWEAWNAELRQWAAEDPSDDEAAYWLERSAFFRRAIDELYREDADMLRRLVDELAPSLTEASVAEMISDPIHGRGYADLFVDLQEFHDQDWLTVAKAAEIRLCSTTYIRRLARERLEPSDKRRLPDGRWLVRCGAIRTRRKR